MSDLQLRRAERDWIENPTYYTYCRYVAHLQRHAGMLQLDPFNGVAHGFFPAAVHLLAPWKFTRIPKYWDSSLSPADAGCLPPGGILGYILFPFFDNLMSLSPRHCTCGGEERGHAPNCEMVVGTGDFSEDFYYVMRQWFTGRPPSHGHSLLDRYLEEGILGIHYELVAAEYNMMDLVNVVNARLGWNFTFTWQVFPPSVLEYPGLQPITNVRFDFILQDWGPRQTNTSLRSHFAFHLNSQNLCEIEWRVNPDWRNEDSPWRRSAEQISTGLARRISSIPQLLQEYRVWQEGPVPPHILTPSI